MFNYTLYQVGQFLALSLPLRIAYKLAVFFSDLHYIFADKDRKIVKENLKAIFPQKSERQICKMRKNVFRNFAKYLVDFFRFEKLNKEYIAKHIRIENIHHIDEALTEKKGAIVLTAHLGNWELGGVVISLSGYPFWAVALPHKDKRVDRFFNFQRESKGVKVIPLGKAVRTCLDVLKKNEIVALVGDRDFTGNGIVLELFGKPTFFPEGPAAFSLKTGARILPGFMLRNKDDSFTLRIEKPIDFKPSGNHKKDIVEIILRYRIIFEDYIRRFPDQWYMFRKFWIER